MYVYIYTCVLIDILGILQQGITTIAIVEISSTSLFDDLAVAQIRLRIGLVNLLGCGKKPWPISRCYPSTFLNGLSNTTEKFE
jgi:hypothetical protein